MVFLTTYKRNAKFSSLSIVYLLLQQDLTQTYGQTVSRAIMLMLRRTVNTMKSSFSSLINSHRVIVPSSTLIMFYKIWNLLEVRRIETYLKRLRVNLRWVVLLRIEVLEKVVNKCVASIEKSKWVLSSFWFNTKEVCQSSLLVKTIRI